MGQWDKIWRERKLVEIPAVVVGVASVAESPLAAPPSPARSLT